METPTKPALTKDVKIKINQILTLYSNVTLSELLNDLVAIGTWLTPEKPHVKRNKDDLVKTTVPILEKPKELKRLLDELVKVVGERKVGEVLRGT
jgi:hypothetical protein